MTVMENGLIYIISQDILTEHSLAKKEERHFKAEERGRQDLTHVIKVVRTFTTETNQLALPLSQTH